MQRCLGITRNLHRCGRVGNWRIFCHEHRRQPLVWLSFILFTVVGGIASIYTTLSPHISPERESNATTSTLRQTTGSVDELIAQGDEFRSKERFEEAVQS